MLVLRTWLAVGVGGRLRENGGGGWGLGIRRGLFRSGSSARWSKDKDEGIIKAVLKST